MEFTETTTVILLVSAFFTSMLSSVLGMGGGISLLSVMMLFFPPTILIPIHGIVQLFSNGTRVLINLKSVLWQIFIPIVIGGVFGAAMGSRVVLNIPTEIYQPMLAVFILFLTWRPKSTKKPTHFKFKFYILGFFSHFLSLVFGATGPFIAPFFLKESLTRYQIIATKAATQFTGHLFKIIIFMMLGVSFSQYTDIIILMVLSVILGTYIGKLLLNKIPEKLFLILFKILITTLCLVMVAKSFNP